MAMKRQNKIRLNGESSQDDLIIARLNAIAFKNCDGVKYCPCKPIVQCSVCLYYLCYQCLRLHAHLDSMENLRVL